jgi:hypothetical protein
VDCTERNRLVSNHLKAIAEWKEAFDDREAWEKAVEAERAVVEHCEKHGCQAQSENSRTQTP